MATKADLESREANCKSIADFVELAQTALTEPADSDYARALLQKAARYCGDIASTVAYAHNVQTLFADTAWAANILGNAETDCQFPKDFVQLAEGFKNVLGNLEKARELLQQGADFAMTGAEHLDIANAYWSVLQDADAATDAYKKALSDINDRNQLLSLAKTVAQEVGNKTLAKAIYAKVESKSAAALDLAKLAQAACDDLQDKDYAAEIYARAASKLSGTNDLLMLAGEVLKNLGHRETALALFQKALTGTQDFNGFIKLLDASHEKLADVALARMVLEKAEKAATTTAEFMDIAERTLTILQDTNLATRLLATAEERVTGVDDMRKVTAAVKQHFAENTAWVTQVEEKLEKRIANQAKYAEFQKREESCQTLKHYLTLVDEVMHELADTFYTSKLLSAAEKILEGQNFDFNQYRRLILAIDKHLKHGEWVKRLFDFCAQQCRYFACLRQVARSAATELTDKALGKQLAQTYYHNQERFIGEAATSSVYDYSKLAAAVYEDIADESWAKALLSQAETLKTDHFGLAQLGKLAETLGDNDGAQRLYQKAANLCTDATQFIQLGWRLRSYQLANESLRNFYGLGMTRLKMPVQQLQWAEGIVDIFADREWAKRVYDQLASSFTTDKQKVLFNASRKHKLARSV